MMKTVQEDEANFGTKQAPPQFPIRVQTLMIIIIGVLAGGFLALLAKTYSTDSFWYVLFLTAGAGFISTALISLALDIVWTQERGQLERQQLEPILHQGELFTIKLGKIEDRLDAIKNCGLNACLGSRSEALDRFYKYANEIIGRHLAKGDPESANKVQVVSSSARGLVGFFDRPPSVKQRRWRKLITDHPERFEILLTHPAYAYLRQPAEERGSGDIELEILKTAVYLNRIMNENGLRFYRGSPTVFAIQAGTHILLNPYPYGRMAMDSLCLEFEYGTDEKSFVSSFMDKHFDQTWSFINAPSKNVGGRSLVEGVHDLNSILSAFAECTYCPGSKQLRLTSRQVEELDVFYRKQMEDGRNREKDHKTEPLGGHPFADCVKENKLVYADDPPSDSECPYKHEHASEPAGMVQREDA